MNEPVESVLQKFERITACPKCDAMTETQAEFDCTPEDAACPMTCKLDWNDALIELNVQSLRSALEPTLDQMAQERVPELTRRFKERTEAAEQALREAQGNQQSWRRVAERLEREKGEAQTDSEKLRELLLVARGHLSVKTAPSDLLPRITEALSPSPTPAQDTNTQFKQALGEAQADNDKLREALEALLDHVISENTFSCDGDSTHFECICDVDGQGNHAPLCLIEKAEAAINRSKERL